MTASAKPVRRLTWLWIALAFVVGLALMAAVGALLTSIQGRKQEAATTSRVVPISATELDPAVWGKNYPREYSSFMKTQDRTIKTPYGGSDPWSKLEKFPALKRIWAAMPFSVDYNEESGHYYALSDQKETKRQVVAKQPAACANCHAAEAPLLIEQMGWEKFNVTPYTEISGTLHFGS